MAYPRRRRRNSYSAPSVPRNSKRVECTIDFADVKMSTLAAANGEYDKASDVNANGVEDLARYWRTQSSWVGGPIEDLLDYMRNGYDVRGGKVPLLEAPLKERRKIRYGDEGELQVDLALSGSDMPFMKWDKRPSKPGLKVTLEYWFSSSTPAETIKDYGEWVAEMLARYEQEGYDLEVTVRIPSDSTFADGNESSTVNLIVKRQNEASDFASWSCLFAPQGFRTLGFMSMLKMGDKLKRQISHYLGTADSGRNWSVKYDSASRTISLGAPSMEHNGFPAEMMTAQLQAINTDG